MNTRSTASVSAAGAVAVAVALADGRLRQRIERLLRDNPGVALTDDPRLADVLVADAVNDRDVPVVVVGEPDLVARALREGALGGLRSDCSGAHLSAAIEAAVVGLACFEPSVVRSPLAAIVTSDNATAMADEADWPQSPLSARESEVLALLTGGASNKQIARTLGISVHTAKFHVAAIVAKFGARSRTAAVARAVKARALMV